jgi:NAD+ synthase
LASTGTYLSIDEDRALEALQTYIREACAELSVSSVLLGLSGGIDSAVLSAVAVRALGKNNVHVAYIYDRDSGEELGRNAGLVADWLGLDVEKIGIDPSMHEKGIYEPVVMRITSVSGTFNRVLHGLYRLLGGEPPFITSLRQGDPTTLSPEERNKGYEYTAGFPETAFNVRHIFRREILELRASAENRLLLGAANRTEWMTGWFVKGGIDDVPIQPLKGLYKTQVRQLAEFLNVPLAVRSQAPSPDMMKGITDEFALGMSYNKIDLALDHIEGGVSLDDIRAAGITEKEVARVRRMKSLSRWKRADGDLPPPVDGGPGGGFRV